MLLTFISRVSDGLVMCETTEDNSQMDLSEYRNQAKKLVKTFTTETKKACFISTLNRRYFFYIIKNDVAFLSLFDSDFPQSMAIKFLRELATEFDLIHGADVATAKRPFCFISFDSFVEKTKKAYSNISDLQQIKSELNEVQETMTKNISDIIDVGETLTSIERKSDDLIVKSVKYYEEAKDLNKNMMLKKYAPFAVVFIIIVLFFYLLFF